MPLGHLGINVADPAIAKAYYDELMPLLAFEPFIVADDQISYRPADGKVGAWLFFYRSIEGGEDSRHSAGLQHLAFMLKTRAEVRRVHDWATARGAEVMHEPREFPEYHPGYYATFWLDPHGFMLEAVCHRDLSVRAPA